MGNEAPPINPIEATVKEIKIKKEIEEKIQQDKKALADMQAPLVNYRPGMIVADNQAAFFTLPNYMGDVTILNVGRNNFQVGKINSIKYGKNVKVTCLSIVGKDTTNLAYEGAPFQIPNLQGGDKIWTVSVASAPVPKIVAASSTYEECIYAVENTGFIPKVTWGTTPANKQDASCDQKLCDYWPKKYPNGIPPLYQTSAVNCQVKITRKEALNTNKPENKVMSIEDIIKNVQDGNRGELTKKEPLITTNPTVATQNSVVSNIQSQLIKNANVIAPVQLDNASTSQLTIVKSNDNREWECRPVGSNFPEKKQICPPVNVTCTPCQNKVKKVKKTKKVSKKKSIKLKESSIKSEKFTETFADLQDDYCYLNLVVGLLIIAIFIHLKGGILK
jgi:hypothetical protein